MQRAPRRRSGLTARQMAIFTRLTVGERMPARKPVRRAASRIARPRDPGRGWRLQLGQAARRWLWLAAVLALVALTVVLSHGTGLPADRPAQAAQG
jgi:hypothetical protein